MRYVCPEDVKKMLWQQARKVYWKRLAAKHEYEELKVGVWLEPARALMRKKTKEGGNEHHRNVARKFFLEGCWVQKRLFDIGWSDESVKPATRRKALKRTGSTTAQHGTRSEGISQEPPDNDTKKP